MLWFKYSYSYKHIILIKILLTLFFHHDSSWPNREEILLNKTVCVKTCYKCGELYSDTFWNVLILPRSIYVSDFMNCSIKMSGIRFAFRTWNGSVCKATLVLKFEVLGIQGNGKAVVELSWVILISRLPQGQWVIRSYDIIVMKLPPR